MIVAIPKRDIKPTISVMVVSITPPAKAGSILNLASTKGRLTPLIAPMIKLIISYAGCKNAYRLSAIRARRNARSD